MVFKAWLAVGMASELAENDTDSRVLSRAEARSGEKWAPEMEPWDEWEPVSA